jgi:hypothetical protein
MAPSELPVEDPQLQTPGQLYHHGMQLAAKGHRAEATDHLLTAFHNGSVGLRQSVADELENLGEVETF